MADGEFTKGKLTIRVDGPRLRVSMYDSEAGMTEVLDAPDMIRLGLWLRENKPK